MPINGKINGFPKISAWRVDLIEDASDDFQSLPQDSNFTPQAPTQVKDDPENDLPF